MGVFFSVISLNLTGLKRKGLQCVIEEDPCPGSFLTVDESDILADEILQCFNLFRKEGKRDVRAERA